VADAGAEPVVTAALHLKTSHLAPQAFGELWQSQPELLRCGRDECNAVRRLCLSQMLNRAPTLPLMKSILSGVLADERLRLAESSARALPVEFIELSRINYGV
jgi:hypothetical protein